MKLTPAQITLIQSALKEHVDLCQARSGRAPLGDDKDFWAAEAVEACQLYILFQDAHNVEVESVKLKPAKDACGDIHCHGQCPVKPGASPEADAATNDAAECEELRVKIAVRQKSFQALVHQARKQRHAPPATSQTAAGADATAAAAVLEGPGQQPEHAPVCGAPMPAGPPAPSALPVPGAAPLAASSQSAPAASPPQTGNAAPTAPALAPAPHASPAPASSARSNTAEGGGSLSSQNPTEEAPSAN